jgi:hypothetical protein
LEDVTLYQILLQTADPAGLERFLSDVLGAEIETLDTQEFVATVNELRLHVREGDVAEQELLFKVPLSESQALTARWEFFCFRHSYPSCPKDIVFNDGQGLRCRIEAERVISANENLNISVRNY